MLAMVFMQASIAAHACAGLQAMQSTTHEMPCHPAGDPAPVPHCDAHCDDGAQNVYSWPAFAQPFVPSFSVSLAAADLPVALIAPRDPALLHATSPPIPIRNCCLRN